MANSLGDMVVRILGDITDFDKKLTQAETHLKQSGVGFAALGTKLSLAVTAPLTLMGVAAVKSAASMEMLEASFTTMLGSAEKASVLMNNLIDMAARTPFETTDLANAGKTLLQFGVAGDQVIGILGRLGDASSGNSDKMRLMALAYGQIQATGRLMGQDLLQLINAGFNPLQEIARTTGRTMGDLKLQMEKGGISAQMVAEAFKTATSEGGRFYGGMATASKTLTGLISTLNDDVGAMGRSFVEDLMPAIKDTVKQLSSAAKWVTGLDESSKSMILTFAGIAASLGPIALGISLTTKAVESLKIGLAFLGANPIVLGLMAVATAALIMANSTKRANIEAKALEDTLAGIADLETQRTALRVANNRILAADLEQREFERQNQGKRSQALQEEQDAAQTLVGTITKGIERTKVLAENKAAASAKAIKDAEAEAKALGTTGAKAKEVDTSVVRARNDRNRALTAMAEAYYAKQISEVEFENQVKNAYAEDEVRQHAERQIAMANAESERYNAIDVDRQNNLKKVEDYYKREKSFRTYYGGYDTGDNTTDLVNKNPMTLVNSALSSLDIFMGAYNRAANREIEIVNKTLAKKVKALNDELKLKLKNAGLAEKSAKEVAAAELKAAEDARDGKLSILDQQYQAIDENQQAILYALGLTGAATLDQYDTEIAAALAAGDTETAIALEKERAILAINQDFDAQRKAIADAEKVRLAQDELIRQSLMQGTIDAISAAEEAASLKAESLQQTLIDTSEGPFLGLMGKIGEAFKEMNETDFSDFAAGMMSVRDALIEAAPQLMLNTGLMILSKDLKNPVGWALVTASGLLKISNTSGLTETITTGWDKFAHDYQEDFADPIEREVGKFFKSIFGHAEGTDYAPGGLSIVGEQGPELVNLPRGSQVLNSLDTSRALSTGVGGGPIHLVVNLDSKPFLDTIFPASQNGTIQIDARSVV